MHVYTISNTQLFFIKHWIWYKTLLITSDMYLCELSSVDRDIGNLYAVVGVQTSDTTSSHLKCVNSSHYGTWQKKTNDILKERKKQ